MINLETEQLISLAEACRLLPQPPSPPTLWRWRTRGVRVGSRTIRLETVKVGVHHYTTREAFARFLREQTEAAAAVRDQPAEAERSESTERRLQAAGLL